MAAPLSVATNVRPAPNLAPQDIVAVPRAWLQRLAAPWTGSPSLHSQGPGKTELVIPLSRPLKAGALGRLEACNDLVGLIERALLRETSENPQLFAD
jgi:hypothetical protein